MYICNAFSLSMLPSPEHRWIVAVIPVKNPREIVRGKKVESFVGHADTARLFSQILGVPVECRRESLRLEDGRGVLVGQYVGPRLPEGATELPEGARIDWFFVRVEGM